MIRDGSPRISWRARGRAGEERGTVIVIVAGMLVGFTVLLAFTIDLGAGRRAEQQAQTAAEAAALAAADAIPAGNASTKNSPCSPRGRRWRRPTTRAARRSS